MSALSRTALSLRDRSRYSWSGKSESSGCFTEGLHCCFGLIDLGNGYLPGRGRPAP